jgi:hypothetical protein
MEISRKEGREGGKKKVCGREGGRKTGREEGREREREREKEGEGGREEEREEERKRGREEVAVFEPVIAHDVGLQLDMILAARLNLLSQVLELRHL